MTFVETTPTITPPIEQLEEIKLIKKPRKKRQPKHDFGDGFGRINAHRHDNGKGWVADTARVDETVYVGRRCKIFDHAIVRNNVRLEGEAKISGHAVVSGGVKLSQMAHVYGTAIVRDRTQLTNSARVFGAAQILGSSTIADNACVFDSAQIVSTTLTGHASVSGRAFIMASNVNGAIEIKGNCAVIKSQINGWVLIDNNANVIKSSIHNHRQGVFVRLLENAIVGNDSTIYMPIVVKGHAVILSSLLPGDLSISADNVFELNGNTVIQRQTFRNQNELRNFIALLTQNASPTGVAQITPNGQVANFAARRVELPAAGPRRVMRLQEAEA